MNWIDDVYMTAFEAGRATACMEDGVPGMGSVIEDAETKATALIDAVWPTVQALARITVIAEGRCPFCQLDMTRSVPEHEPNCPLARGDE